MYCTQYVSEVINSYMVTEIKFTDWYSVAFMFSFFFFSEQIRLVNGTQRCEGRVEIKHNDEWRKICTADWSQKEHEVVCRELSCGIPLIGQDMPNFGELSAPIGMKANCLGNETSIMQCILKETDQTCHSASLLCACMLTLIIGNACRMCTPLGGCFHPKCLTKLPQVHTFLTWLAPVGIKPLTLAVSLSHRDCKMSTI